MTLHRTNLPVQPAPFLGRRRELETVLARASSSRLLTLTGTGGTGKTRLALQVAAGLAEELPGGVLWVPLASLRHQSLVGSAVAAALSEAPAEQSSIASRSERLRMNDSPRVNMEQREEIERRVLALHGSRLDDCDDSYPDG